MYIYLRIVDNLDEFSSVIGNAMDRIRTLPSNHTALPPCILHQFRVQPGGCTHCRCRLACTFPCVSARGSVYTVCHLANEQSPLGIRHPWFLKPWAVRSPTLLPRHPYVSLSLSPFDPHNLPSSTPSFPSRSPSTFTLTASSLRLSLSRLSSYLSPPFPILVP